MAKLSKRIKANKELVDSTKLYDLTDAVKLLKETSNTKFDSTIEIAFNLNLDPTKADQQLRGAMMLPNGTGKTSKVLVFA